MADEGAKYTDKELEKMEKKIKQIYSEAEKDIQKKMNEFNQAFKAKEAIHLQELKDGKITQADFDAWKRGQVFQGQQWQSKKDQISGILYNANKEAAKILNGGTVDVFAENANWSHYEMEHTQGVNFGFGLYDANTVTNLIKNDPQVLPKWKINEKKDYKWNGKKVDNAITQGIIQGERLDQIADRISTALSANNRNTMLTFARTAMTGAQNAGRNQGLMDAKDLGINVVKVWMATLDDHTRASHQEIDGEEQKVGDKWHSFKFSNGCRYPGDPLGPPHEVYNCRCTMVSEVKDYPSDYKRRDNINGEVIDRMTYKEWKQAKLTEEATPPVDIQPEVIREVVEGTDISDTWVWDREESEFDFAIEDVIHTQGFDGLPKVVSAEEFDQVYTGEQPLLLRTFSAPNEEVLNAYDDMLRNGKWYVDCSNGGADYGQGMYTVGIYGGKDDKKTAKKLEGAMSEMRHYQTINGRSDMVSMIETMTLDPSAKIITYKELTNTPDFKAAFKAFNREQSYYADRTVFDKLSEVVSSANYLSNSDKSYLQSELDKSMKSIEKSYNKGTTVSTDKFNRIINNISYRQLGYTGDMSNWEEWSAWQRTFDVVVERSGGNKSFSNELPDLMKSEDLDANVASKAFDSVIPINKYAGVYGASKGYDAINAVGHGDSGSYTVVLNRTKLIIKEGE